MSRERCEELRKTIRRVTPKSTASMPCVPTTRPSTTVTADHTHRFGSHDPHDDQFHCRTLRARFCGVPRVHGVMNGISASSWTPSAATDASAHRSSIVSACSEVPKGFASTPPPKHTGDRPIIINVPPQPAPVVNIPREDRPTINCTRGGGAGEAD